MATAVVLVCAEGEGVRGLVGRLSLEAVVRYFKSSGVKSSVWVVQSVNDSEKMTTQAGNRRTNRKDLQEITKPSIIVITDDWGGERKDRPCFKLKLKFQKLCK